MYTIYVDGNLLYSPERTSEGYSVTSARLVREVNLADTLEFTVPPTNSAANSITMLGSRIVVFQDGHVIFVGRAVTAKKNMYNLVTYHCEGGLAYYRDVMRKISKGEEVAFSYFYNEDTEGYSFVNIAPRISAQYLPSSYNNKKFINYDQRHVLPLWWEETGDCRPVNGVKYENDIIRDKSLLDLFHEDILPRYGGSIVLDYTDATSSNDEYLVRVFWYESGSEPLNSQTIEYGHNLLDIAQDIDYSGVRTVYRVIGSNVTGNTKRPISIYPDRYNDTYGYMYAPSASQSLNTVYIPSIDDLNTYGWIEDHLEVASDKDMSITSFSEYQDYMHDSVISYAASKAQTQLKFTCKAIDLHMIDSEQSTLQVGRRNRILSSPNGIDTTILCTRSEIDLLDPARSQYSFGSSMSILTGMVNPDIVSRIGTSVNILNSIVTDTSD